MDLSSPVDSSPKFSQCISSQWTPQRKHWVILLQNLFTGRHGTDTDSSWKKTGSKRKRRPAHLFLLVCRTEMDPCTTYCDEMARLASVNVLLGLESMLAFFKSIRSVRVLMQTLFQALEFPEGLHLWPISGSKLVP